MMDGLVERGVAAGAARVAAVVEALAGADVPAGAVAFRDGDDVVVTGRGLVTALAWGGGVHALVAGTDSSNSAQAELVEAFGERFGSTLRQAQGDHGLEGAS